MSHFASMAKAPFAMAFRAASRVNFVRRPREVRYVFILAQKRSGSSVVAEMLTSNPDFVSAGETPTIYDDPDDLPNLFPRSAHAKYLVDKITTDRYLPREEILLSPLVHKCVISVRAPEGSLKSLMSRYRCDESTALAGYVGRLKELVRYGRVLRERALLVQYGHLMKQTREILVALTRFFDVEQPFTSNFLADDSHLISADPSPDLLIRRILEGHGYDVRVGAEVIAQAQQAFQTYRRELLDSGVISAVAE
jgi:hypothetical protein